MILEDFNNVIVENDRIALLTSLSSSLSLSLVQKLYNDTKIKILFVTTHTKSIPYFKIYFKRLFRLKQLKESISKMII